jgi:hypothetical protein
MKLSIRVLVIEIIKAEIIKVAKKLLIKIIFPFFIRFY